MVHVMEKYEAQEWNENEPYNYCSKLRLWRSEIQNFLRGEPLDPPLVWRLGLCPHLSFSSKQIFLDRTLLYIYIAAVCSYTTESFKKLHVWAEPGTIPSMHYYYPPQLLARSMCCYRNKWVAISYYYYDLLYQVCYSGGGCIHCEVHCLQGSQFQYSMLLWPHWGKSNLLAAYIIYIVADNYYCVTRTLGLICILH